MRVVFIFSPGDPFTRAIDNAKRQLEADKNLVLLTPHKSRWDDQKKWNKRIFVMAADSDCIYVAPGASKDLMYPYIKDLATVSGIPFKQLTELPLNKSVKVSTAYQLEAWFNRNFGWLFTNGYKAQI